MFMRPVIMLLLVLLMPLSTAFLSNGEDFTSGLNQGQEVEILLDQGVWEQNNWNLLKQEGFTPLRVLSPSLILAWSDGESGALDIWATVGEASPAQYKSASNALHPLAGDEIKLLFEPRLPPQAIEQIQQRLAAFAIEASAQQFTAYSPIPSNLVTTWNYGADEMFSQLLALDGLLWVEPVLSTNARNTQAATVHQNGQFSNNPAWDLGLNGSGVIVAMADSGLDADHSCFRNATATSQFGSEGDNGSDAEAPAGASHRKLLLLNESLDSGDNIGHDDYRHGTHVAGTLSCFDVYDYRNGTTPNTGSSLAHGSSLIFQDVVSSEGWVVPDVDLLLYEATINGAVIHSDSWGDNTAQYTARSGDFDAWGREFPWSLAFIAPGNNGGEILEPANARNVAAIGASIKNNQSQRWAASAHGPMVGDTNGIFALATGTSILSAKADGLDASYNDDLRLSSGTSMATPMAASSAAIIQQMVEQGWIRSDLEAEHSLPIVDLRPQWSDRSLNNQSSLILAEGFTPSGPMLRALMAIASTPLPLDERNAGQGGQQLRNPYDGFGRLNLSQLIDFEQLENDLGQGNVSPASDIWVHDSYRLQQHPKQLLATRSGNLSPLENLADNPWDGQGASGPFLESGDIWTKRFSLQEGENLDVSMAFPSSPEPYLVDDMMLVVRLSDGKVAISGKTNNDGSNTLYYENVVDYSNNISFPASNETTVKIHLDADDLSDVEWIELEVRARYIAPGNSPTSVGIDGNKNGFSLVAKGVLRDYSGWMDDDLDGIENVLDNCPTENSIGFDIDSDGCLDDSDGDMITDDVDLCNGENASSFDDDSDGCIDDTDGDSVKDNIDLCYTEIIDENWPVMANGCRPVDQLPELTIVTELDNGSVWQEVMVVRWLAQDPDGDPLTSGVKLMILENNSTSAHEELFRCIPMLMNNSSGEYFCIWVIPNNLPSYDINGRQLHLQFFAQSANNSPQANNQLVIERSANNFTSYWHNSSEEGNTNSQGQNDSEIARQKIILALAICGLIGGLIGALIIAINYLRNKSQKEAGDAVDKEQPAIERDVV